MITLLEKEGAGRCAGCLLECPHLVVSRFTTLPLAAEEELRLYVMNNIGNLREERLRLIHVWNPVSGFTTGRFTLPLLGTQLLCLFSTIWHCDHIVYRR